MELTHFVTVTRNDGSDVVISVGNDGFLYVDGKKVLTQEKIKFSGFVTIAAIGGGLGAFGFFLIEAFKAWKVITF